MTSTLAASAFDSLRLDAVPDPEALRQVYELAGDAALRKQATDAGPVADAGADDR